MSVRASPRVLRLVIRGKSIYVSKVDLAITEISRTNFRISIVPRAKRRAALLRGVPKSLIGLRGSIVKGCMRGLLNVEGGRRRGGGSKVAVRFLRRFKF